MAKTTRACSLCKRRLGLGSYSERQWKLDSLSRKCEDCCPVNKPRSKTEDYATTLTREVPNHGVVVKRQPPKRDEQEVISGLAQAIRCGLDVNRPNKTGLTVLMVAARSGHSEVVDWLLANSPGIDLDTKSPQGETAIVMASRQNKPNLVLALASRGADVTGVVGHDGILACGMEVYMLTVFEALLGPHSALKLLLIPPLVAICVDYLDSRLRFEVTQNDKLWRKLTEGAQLHVAKAFNFDPSIGSLKSIRKGTK